MMKSSFVILMTCLLFSCQFSASKKRTGSNTTRKNPDGSLEYLIHANSKYSHLQVAFQEKFELEVYTDFNFFFPDGSVKMRGAVEFDGEVFESIIGKLQNLKIDSVIAGKYSKESVDLLYYLTADDEQYEIPMTIVKEKDQWEISRPI